MYTFCIHVHDWWMRIQNCLSILCYVRSTSWLFFVLYVYTGTQTINEAWVTQVAFYYRNLAINGWKLSCLFCQNPIIEIASISLHRFFASCAYIILDVQWPPKCNRIVNFGWHWENNLPCCIFHHIIVIVWRLVHLYWAA